jgi:hypothetical protein
MVAVQVMPVTTVDDRESIEADLQRIAFRLEDGFEKIVRAAAEGEDVSRWEDIWLRLLNDYERLHDRLAA